MSLDGTNQSNEFQREELSVRDLVNRLGVLLGDPGLVDNFGHEPPPGTVP